MQQPSDTPTALAEAAFQRFGASLLWNVRRPQPGEPVSHDRLQRIARRLAREGGAEAVQFARTMLVAVEEADAGSCARLARTMKTLTTKARACPGTR